MFLHGSTSIVEPVSPGIVVKQPISFPDNYLAEHIANSFSAERRILERLGQHPRIVSHLGSQGEGILLGEASHGNLQAYLDNHPSIDLGQRLKWCRQIAEALDYVHSRGVVHSDLRPGNILVHETVPGARDVLLADFGGSGCAELGAKGLALPDGPFYNPVFENKSSTLLDLFGMGSVFYTVLTGRWPFKETPGRFDKIDDRLDWEDQVVYPNFEVGKFPSVEDLPVGDVILRCWRREFATAKDALTALDKALKAGGHCLES